MAQQEMLNLLEFQERFPDDAACREFLFRKRWPEGFSCPKCGHKQYYVISSRHLYECAECGYQASVTANTIMHRTRTSLRKWFWAIYLVASDKRGCSATALKEQINVSYQTAWTMLHKIRHAMSLREKKYVLCGFIRLDEAFFGGPNGKQGRGTKQASAYVAVSVDAKGHPQYAKIKVSDKINQNTAAAFVRDTVVKGSYVTTDCLNVYNKLLEEGYVHESYLSSEPDCKKALEWVHTIISNAKAFIAGTYHGLSKRHLQVYLEEFCYRFNRRWWSKQLFSRLLTACSSFTTITYRQIVETA